MHASIGSVCRRSSYPTRSGNSGWLLEVFFTGCLRADQYKVRNSTPRNAKAAATYENRNRFAVVIPAKDESVSTPASIKWTSGMNISSTSLSDPEDRMGIPTVSDTASIQTPLGIMTYEVLLKGLFSSPKNELDHRWCRNSRDTERQGKSSRRQSRGDETQATDNDSHDSLSTIGAISHSGVNPPGKGHNLRALRRFGFTALVSGKCLPSFRRKRGGDVKGTHNRDSFDAGSHMENARPSLEQELEEPAMVRVPKRNERNKYCGLRRRTPNQGPKSSPGPLRSPPRAVARRGASSGLHAPPATPQSPSTGETAVTAWRGISGALSPSTPAQGGEREIYRKESRTTKRVTVHKFLDAASGTVRAERFTDYSECEATRIVLRGGRNE